MHGHSYTKLRHKLLQSCFFTTCHSFTWMEKLWGTQCRLLPIRTSEQRASEWVNECTRSDSAEENGPADSEDISKSELGPDGQDELDTMAQTEHHHNHHSSFSGGTKRRLMDRDTWSGEKLWDHGICFRNVNVFLFSFFFSFSFFLFFFKVKCSF